MEFSLFQGDCIEVMRGLPDNSVDSVCTDPPYGLKFMGHRWDCDVPSVDVWREVFRVLKPGGHLLSFSGTRTYHRMVVNIEDAGFEIRDQIMWVYGSGFPKSLDVSKAIDKAAGVEREVVGVDARKASQQTSAKSTASYGDFEGNTGAITAPATPEAQQWQGWGTALKPAFEPLCLAQKPVDMSTEQCTIIRSLLALERKLWSLLLANAAEKNSTSSRNELSAACAIAQWSVEEATNTRVRLCAAMDMSQFESAINTSLSIVSSWRRTLAESLKHGNTSTTETKSSTTTDWTILRFCLSQITPYTITTGLSPQHGQIVFASPAEQYFDAALKMLNATLELSALASVISQDRQSSLAVGGNVSSEPICVARKPLSAKTVAANVIQHGTGAINIDACRVELQGESDAAEFENNHRVTERLPDSYDGEPLGLHDGGWKQRVGTAVIPTGRWPANLMHDGSDEVVSAFPRTKSGYSDGTKNGVQKNAFGKYGAGTFAPTYGDEGNASRFFYSSKASKKDRGEGNTHPTVKPTDVCRWLLRLVTPPGGTSLDLYCGSGSFGKAAILEGFNWIGIDRDRDEEGNSLGYLDIARSRCLDAQCEASGL